MPTISEIAGLLGQYLRDASPGGELNREVQPQVVGDVARGGLLGLTADTLGTPVDLATMAMRPLGYSHPKPVGGSDWIADKLTKPSGSGAETAARTVTGLLTPSPADVAHLVPGLLGATVWHGSPHKFDKFDISKIGTGEGAQAYGHGLYVAESPEVAQSYSTLGHIQGNVSKIAGKPITDVYADLENAASRLPINKAQVNYDKMALLENLMNNQTPSQVLNYAKANNYNAGVIDWFTKKVVPKYEGSGNLYKVDLPDEHIAKMLDWDKPLSQQPESVRKALKPIVDPLRKEAAKTAPGWGDLSNGYNIDNELTGSSILQLMRTKNDTVSNIIGGGGAEVSKKLRELGIPGIKYLDGGSRTAGEGTRNYVVFDDSLLKILERQ